MDNSDYDFYKDEIDMNLFSSVIQKVKKKITTFYL